MEKYVRNMYTHYMYYIQQMISRRETVNILNHQGNVNRNDPEIPLTPIRMAKIRISSGREFK